MSSDIRKLYYVLRTNHHRRLTSVICVYEYQDYVGKIWGDMYFTGIYPAYDKHLLETIFRNGIYFMAKNSFEIPKAIFIILNSSLSHVC
jgi:hypothetical protein